MLRVRALRSRVCIVNLNVEFNTNMTVEPPYKAIASQYKASLDARIPSEWRLPASLALPQNASKLVASSGLLDMRELQITALDATALRDAVAQRVYSAVEVATAYAKAAAVVHQATNCLMDYFPEEAMERAKWLDDHMERTGTSLTADHLGLKGHEITAGFASWAGNNIPLKDSTIIGILRAAGAVFYVKTTNPQAIMQLETDSFLGPTLNPYNRRLTSGGSSGGEGALIGGGGSCMGIGTDIGGSIRNPAANCGVFGFKPTSIRLPKYGNRSAVAGQESIVGAIGPMARSARDLSLFISTILASEPWKLDPTNAGMPWRPSEVTWIGGDKPRIGVMWDDGVVKPQPPMRRALEVAVSKLREAGFDTVGYEPYGTAEAWDIILVRRREAFRVAYAMHFGTANVDVILCPPTPGPAPTLGTSRYWSYTSMFNLVDFPGGVFPTGLTVEPSDKIIERSAFLSKEDEEVWLLYSPEVMVGAPLSLQVLANRWEDEKALAALELISKVVSS
ncbi:amidase, partial [Tremellales sp. Uapishka_1]